MFTFIRRFNTNLERVDEQLGILNDRLAKLELELAAMREVIAKAAKVKPAAPPQPQTKNPKTQERPDEPWARLVDWERLGHHEI